MKRIVYLLAGVVFLLSCSKDENRVTMLGGTAPVLTVSSTADLALAPANAAFSSLQFQWTNPNYQFSNGVNTQDVTYTLEIDTTGSNFTNPNRGQTVFINTVNTSFTVKSLNTALGQLQLVDGKPHAFEFRIKATLANGSVPVYSNVLKINITTYLDVVYPVPAKLYITGSATPGGWQSGSGSETPPPNQTFNKINAYTFQIDNIKLTYTGTGDGDNGFLLIPVYSSWNAKYGFTGSKHANNGSGDTFKPDGSDFAPPSTTGNYKIVVNFKTGKYTMTAVN